MQNHSCGEFTEFLDVLIWGSPREARWDLRKENRDEPVGHQVKLK